MKLLRTTFMALALLALLVPSLGIGGELPVPLEKKILAGTSTIAYAGQNLRFTTPVALLVKLDPEGTSRIRITVVVYPGTPMPQGPASSEPLKIYWANVGTDVYNGGVPVFDPWTGWLNTEGGFVDR